MHHSTVFRRSVVAFLAGLTMTVGGTLLHADDNKTSGPTDAERKAVAALAASGARITINGNYEVTGVSFLPTRGGKTVRPTDELLVHLKALPNITALMLSGSGVTDAGLEHVKQLKGLTSLSVYSSGVTTGALDKLRKELPDCRISTGGFGGPTRGSSSGFGRGPSIFLGTSRTTLIGQLVRREVQAELKLTAEQRDKIVELGQEVTRSTEYRELSTRYREAADSKQRDELRTKITELRNKNQEDASTKAKELLNAKQLARADQLILQALSTAALERKDVAKKVGLSDEQLQQIRSLRTEGLAGSAKLSAERRAGTIDTRTYSARRSELSTQMRENILAVLSAEQRERWTKLLGDPAPRSTRGGIAPRRGTAEATQATTDRVFRFVDRDNDGQLSEVEFLTIRSFHELVERSENKPKFPMTAEQFSEFFRRSRSSNQNQETRRPANDN